MIDQEVPARPLPPPPAQGPAHRRAVIALAVLGCAGGGLVLLVQLLCAVAVGLAALPGPTAQAHPHLGRTGDARAPSTAHAQLPGPDGPADRVVVAAVPALPPVRG